MEAINHGLTVLSWFENYTGDELPHENLWDDAEAVEEHFKRVKERKDAEREGYSTTASNEEGAESGDMLSNDMASVFKR